MIPVLNGRAIVVTGAGSGLGRAYAIDAARHGAAVVVNARDAKRGRAVVDEITSLGGRAVLATGSVADWSAAAETIDTCTRTFGAIDGLVNNAGIRTPTRPPWEEVEADLRLSADTNLLGTMFCAAHALRWMVANGRRGSIVNIGSRALAGARGLSSYAATKGAVVSATYSWALDAAPHGIRVNAVLPSARTPMSRAGESGQRQGAAWEPEGVAPLVTYLLSDLSKEINGQVFHFAKGALGVWRQPGMAVGQVEREAWTPEDVAAALRGPLAASLQPLGRD